MSEKIKLHDGETMLIMVKGGEVIHFTPKMGLRHSEFVKRSTGQLPAGAWVGTVSKRDGQVAAITSKHFFGYLSFVLAIVVLASCTRDSGSRQESEFTKRDRQFQRDYCSTNIIAAAEGLAAFRAWVSDPRNPCDELNRDAVIFSVDARLFIIEERLGDTNAAEQFYRESVDARNRYLAYIQSLHLPDQARPLQPITSKEQLRELVARQDEHRDVGWQKTTGTPK